MDDREIRHHEELEIDLRRLLRALLHKFPGIAMAAVACAVIAFLVTYFLIPPKYQSAAMFYVNNNVLPPGEGSPGISSGDISASRGLVQSYLVILNTRQTLNAVMEASGIDRTYEELKNMITAEAVDSTEIFRVVVTSPDPQEAEKIASAVADILPSRISGILEGTSARIVDSAVAATSPSSPGYLKNMAAGFAAGMILAAGWIVLNALMDSSIRSEDDLIQNCTYPVLAAIPDMKAHLRKGGYRKRAGDTPEKKSNPEPVGGNISHRAAEAYKLLRTKLPVCFAGEDGCRVIGISSALAGEGKSLTALNLADAFSQLGKRVLLLECDLRCPDLADKVPIREKPGLSDFLCGQASGEKLLQLCSIREGAGVFHVISSGTIPQNPMELLSTKRMAHLMEHLRQRYDYILVDLPPVGEVADPLAAAKLTDGILLVVRQDACNSTALKETIRQFEFMEARILGIVFNAATEREPHRFALSEK